MHGCGPVQALFRLALDSNALLAPLRQDPAPAAAGAAEALAAALSGQTLVVHEGDSPNALAAGLCAHHQVAPAGSAARAAAIARLSDHITATFSHYFASAVAEAQLPPTAAASAAATMEPAELGGGLKGSGSGTSSMKVTGGK